jgi:alpha-amylase
MKDVILHAFDWQYADITRCAQKIAELGYGAVLIPPPLYSRSDAGGNAWWQRYQPKDYRVLRSFLGNKSELEALIAALHEHGVRVLVDIVFNHMANESRVDRLNFPGKDELANYQQNRLDFERDRLYGNLSEGLFSPWDFNLGGNIQNWMDVNESTQLSLSGLPDLHLTEWVIQQQQMCLEALNEMGIDGYRVDAIKHLPEAHVHQVFETENLADKFLFGEALTANDAEEGIFLWPVFHDTRLAFYDFPLHETMRRVFAPSGDLRELVDPAAFGQALPWSRAVIFSVTHDMPNNEGFRGVILQNQDEFLANVYLLGRDGGSPLVYSDNNESAKFYPDDKNRWANAWQREDIAAMLRFHNAVHGQKQRSLYEDQGFLVFARGDSGIFALNKTNDWQHPTISTHELRPGNYQCQIHGFQMVVQGEQFNFAIPPRQAQMWLAQ